MTIGTNTITSIARHFIMPQITDQIYNSNVLLHRIMKGNKRMVQGGTHIEVPLMYSRFGSGGAYSGYDVFDTTPHDTVKNATFNWKQHQVTWSVDGLTMLKADSPLAIANFLTLQSQQAYMEMAENLAVGLFSDGTTDTKDIDGLDGLQGVSSTFGNQNYGGLDRTANSFWDASMVTGADAMDNAMLMTSFTGASRGGQHPTIIVSGQDQWNRFWALGQSATSVVQNVREPQGHDELLQSAGFTNLLFNTVPWVADSHVNAGSETTNTVVHMLNENFLHWVVSPRADFYLKPFQEPHNQDAMVASLLWAGNLVCSNPDAQGGHRSISS